MSTPTFTTTLWSTADGARYFLISNESVLHPGSVELRCLDGRTKAVEVQGLVPLEVTEHQARRWAKDQLGQTLDELRHGIGERLADLRARLDEKNRTPVTEKSPVTPNAAPALFDLLKKLPGVIGNSFSSDEKRVESAKTAMTDLERQLKEAGIDLGERLTRFPDRLADLRNEVKKERAAKRRGTDEPPAGKP